VSWIEIALDQPTGDAREIRKGRRVPVPFVAGPVQVKVSRHGDRRGCRQPKRKGRGWPTSDRALGGPTRASDLLSFWFSESMRSWPGLQRVNPGELFLYVASGFIWIGSKHQQRINVWIGFGGHRGLDGRTRLSGWSRQRRGQHGTGVPGHVAAASNLRTSGFA
jgi:hypothetical protein